MADAEGPLFCARCSKELQPGRGEFYVVKIRAVADPSGPVITAADLERDLGAEIDQLLAQISRMTEQELKDQVYRRMVIHLCVSCYNTWIENPAGS